ncbi:MAG TPA: ABC transporter permease [Candidatus Limnocylindria bacterium]|jgi:osmoprotectant transport system permease protein
MREGQPFFRFDWLVDNADVLAQRVGEQLYITAIAIAAGFVISFALALVVRRYAFLAGPLLGISGVLYAIPSIAAFVLLIPITHLTLLTAEIVLVSYTLVILVRNLIAGFDAVPAEVLEAADGMGYAGAQRLWRVELPIALPIIIAGLRVATVTTMGLVTIAALIGRGGLGYLIVNIGINQRFPTATITGVVLVVALSALFDWSLALLQRRLTPWAAVRAA